MRLFIMLICVGCFVWPGASNAVAQELKKQGEIAVTIDNSFFRTEWKRDGWHMRGEPNTIFHVRRRGEPSRRVDSDANGFLPVEFHPKPKDKTIEDVALWVDY